MIWTDLQVITVTTEHALCYIYRTNDVHSSLWKCLEVVLTTFFYQRRWSILYRFPELIYSDQSMEYKRLNSSTNYMPEGTLTMQVSKLC